MRDSCSASGSTRNRAIRVEPVAGEGRGIPRFRHTTLNLLLAGAVVLGLACLVGRDIHDARRLRYSLEPRALIVHYRGRISIPYREIKSLVYLCEPPPMRKMAGTNFGAIRFGRFRVEGVGTVQMYAADARHPLLVIRTAERCYGLTPPNPARFHQELLARLPADAPPAISR